MREDSELSEMLTESACFSIHVLWGPIQESPKRPRTTSELVEIPRKGQWCPNFSSKWQVFHFEAPENWPNESDRRHQTLLSISFRNVRWAHSVQIVCVQHCQTEWSHRTQHHSYGTTATVLEPWLQQSQLQPQSKTHHSQIPNSPNHHCASPSNLTRSPESCT